MENSIFQLGNGDGETRMKINRKDRLKRALVHAIEEKERETEGMKALEGLRSPVEMIILRNKKALYIAEVDQIIRNIQDDIRMIEEGERA